MWIMIAQRGSCRIGGLKETKKQGKYTQEAGGHLSWAQSAFEANNTFAKKQMVFIIIDMRIEEITNLLKRTPFEPFGIYMSDGSSYPVRHPDQVIVTPRAVYVGIGVNGPKSIAQNVVICDIIHITRLGPLTKRATKKRK